LEKLNQLINLNADSVIVNTEKPLEQDLKYAIVNKEKETSIKD